MRWWLPTLCVASLLGREGLAVPRDASRLVDQLRQCDTISSQFCIEVAVKLAGAGQDAADRLQSAWPELPRAARFLAAEALGRMGGEQAVGTLGALLRASGGGLERLELAQALAVHKEGAAEAPLVALLGDRSEAVRAVAAEALAQRATGAAGRDALLRAAAGPGELARAAAVRSLGVLGEARGEAVCLDALGAEPTSVRTAAAAALRHIGTRAAVPRLIHALVDDDDGVRAAALASLQGLTHEPFGMDDSLWRAWWEVEGGP